MNLRSTSASLAVAALLAAGLAGCGDAAVQTDATAVEDATAVDTDSAPEAGGADATIADTTNAADAPDGAAAADAVPASADTGLTDDEIAGLVFMREEEKLARDVYLTLFDLWGTPVFENIAASEERHTTAVAGLLEQFAIADPVTDDTVGVFVDPALAALYDDLVEQGSASLVDALMVGALIEDLDIADLREWLDATDDPDIERVYGNLLRGSENHLRAFTGRLEAEGAAYTATYLTQDEIDEILAGDPRGGGNDGGGNGRRRGSRA